MAPITNATDAELAADIRFALASGEFNPQPGRRIFGISPMLRYVAAINPGTTRKDFVRVVVAQGFNPLTATKQFAQSRKFDRDAYGLQVDAEGRQLWVKESA